MVARVAPVTRETGEAVPGTALLYTLWPTGRAAVHISVHRRRRASRDVQSAPHFFFAAICNAVTTALACLNPKRALYPSLIAV